MLLKFHSSNGKLVRTGEEFWFPDDVTIGYIIDHMLKEKLTVVPQFHSHLEPMKSLQNLDQQISFSYSEDNIINLSGPFSSEVDPTRYVKNTTVGKFKDFIATNILREIKFGNCRSSKTATLVIFLDF